MVYQVGRIRENRFMPRPDGSAHNLEIPRLRLDRATLKEQAAALLRSSIISGKIRPGTKLVEREVADTFGISRAPARDALMQLEKEGLVISRPDARYVIELSERDIRELHEVRLALETLAVQLATRNTCPENQLAQQAVLAQMEAAAIAEDGDAFAKADLDAHALVWKQADNEHLENTLRTMLGPIFMFMANATEYYNWQETLELHRDMVRSIASGDEAAATDSIRRHLANSRERAVGIFKARTSNARPAEPD
jgi:DNA-binding GntR family transcriptional regulator